MTIVHGLELFEASRTEKKMKDKKSEREKMNDWIFKWRNVGEEQHTLKKYKRITKRERVIDRERE